ncbi:trypsin-like serine peptidase [Streptomyces sp. NPDC048639]|uniref:trypsin-like serine peptidase n=1 Tax=Streptomyces sp. NPDC048639 TaxID=3365581 RepID=UPI00371A11EA
MPRSVLGALIAVGALLTTGTMAGPAGAAIPGPDRVPSTVHTAADTAAAQKRVQEFWTAERMRKAEPLDLLSVSREDLGGLSADVPTGKAKTVSPVRPSGASTMAFPEGGGPWTGGGKVVTTAGRVFFSYQGRTASCSGNAVTSTNGSTVLTAGHCVKLQGAWHTNWVFVPGYHDGQAPYGRWAAAKTLSTPQWTATEDINYDVGAAVVSPLEGKKLNDVVGGQGVAFNTGYNQDMYSFGFPAADPYDGEKFIHCSGKTFKDFLLSQDHGITCDMTGGSSGGPWFTKFDEKTGTGLQSSVNSFKYNFITTWMFGPVFGNDAKDLYEKAQTS